MAFVPSAARVVHVTLAAAVAFAALAVSLARGSSVALAALAASVAGLALMALAASVASVASVGLTLRSSPHFDAARLRPAGGFLTMTRTTGREARSGG